MYHQIGNGHFTLALKVNFNQFLMINILKLLHFISLQIEHSIFILIDACHYDHMSYNKIKCAFIAVM